MTLRVLVGTEGDHDDIVAAAKSGKRLRFAAPMDSERDDLAAVFTPRGLVAQAKIIEEVAKPSRFRNRPSHFFRVGSFEVLPAHVSLEDVKKMIPTWRWPTHPRRSFCTPQDPVVIAQLLKILKKALPGRAAGTLNASAPNLPPVSAVEGARRERMHSRLERDSALIERAKKAWLKQDPMLACFVCGFSFLKRYGISFIEAHHRIPLATPNAGPRRTTLADLVGVCANCHRTLHREQNLSPENLRDRLIGGHNRQSRKRTA